MQFLRFKTSLGISEIQFLKVFVTHNYCLDLNFMHLGNLQLRENSSICQKMPTQLAATFLSEPAVHSACLPLPQLCSAESTAVCSALHEF